MIPEDSERTRNVNAPGCRSGMPIEIIEFPVAFCQTTVLQIFFKGFFFCFFFLARTGLGEYHRREFSRLVYLDTNREYRWFHKFSHNLSSVFRIASLFIHNPGRSDFNGDFLPRYE